MNQKLVFSPRALVALAVAVTALAVETRHWQQDTFADFEKGTLKRLSLRSDGLLSLAPVVKEWFDSSEPYLWSVAQDSQGRLYAGGGSPSGAAEKLYQIEAPGKSKVIAELEGLEIHALAVDRNNQVYAGTSPDGKVYRVRPGAKAEVFYDPKAKYVWAMAFAANGDLFVATGDKGEIHRVTPQGKGSLFFATEESHARSMAIDAQGNVIVGTEPNGLILRVSPGGQGFVLYQAPKREITAVAVARDGSIYAAGAGTRSSTPVPVPVLTPPVPPAGGPAGGGQPAAAIGRTVPTAPPTMAPAAPSITGGSELYRILPDGLPRKVWSHPSELVYSLAMDAQDRPVVGTGNRGNVYRLDSELRHTLLVNLNSTQVTALLAPREGGLVAVTGNAGKLFRIGPQLEKDGTFESEFFDVGGFSYWGRLQYSGQGQSGGVKFETRSGNLTTPLKNWSLWETVPLENQGGRIASPATRFLQYRATLTVGADGGSPVLQSVDIAYQPRNIAPGLTDIEVTPPNYRFPAASAVAGAASPATLSLPPLGQARRPTVPLADISSSASLTYSRGWIGARWSAADDNGDQLSYKVEIRGVNESQWKLLRDKVREKYVSFEAVGFADGEYVLRVTASDSPSNPPDQALTAQIESEPFLIDNSAPRVVNLTANPSGGKLQVSFSAEDARSILTRAEYSVNGGEWVLLESATRLSDSRGLSYQFTIDRPANSEVTVAVRVTDAFDNQTVEKVIQK